MDKELHDSIDRIIMLMYKNDDDAMVDFQQILPRFQQYLQGEAANEQAALNIKEILTLLVDGFRNKDELLIGDTLYTVLRDKTEIPPSIGIACDVYDKNLEFFKDKQCELCEKIKAAIDDYDENNDNVMIDENGNMAVYEHNRWWRMNSYAAPEYAISSALSNMPESYLKLLFIFGMGNMSYIRAIADRVSGDSVIMVYEPCFSIFLNDLYCFDFESIFKNKKVFFYIDGINDNQVVEFVDIFVNRNSNRYAYTFISPTYLNLYAEKTIEKINEISTYIQYKTAAIKSINDYAEEFNYNRIMNLKLLPRVRVLPELKTVFETAVDVHSIPAIVVASGPSLDKNIEHLRKAKGKAFIIATDSSARMLDRYGIMPDIMVTVDANKEDVLFENEVAENTPLFFADSSRHDMIKHLKGQKVMFATSGLCKSVLDELHVKMPFIHSGGTVTTTAVSIADELGFRNIIVIGMDLAFSGDKKHASVVYDDGGVNDSESDQYTHVKGQNGEMLLTYKNFMIYKDFLENYLKDNKEKLNFVNATEGGAFIEGARHMTLMEAIDMYCTKEIDVREILKECFSKEQLVSEKAVKKLLETDIQDCEYIMQQLDLCNREYDKMKNGKKADDIRENILRVNELLDKINKKEIFYIVCDYANANSEEYLDNVYANATNSGKSDISEVQNIVSNGRKVIDLYIKETKHTEGLLKQCLEEI